MAIKSEALIPLAGVDFSSLSKDDLKSMYREILQTGMHGISFSFYVDGQQPGTFIPAEQIRQRLKIIRPSTDWIRTFSCTDGQEAIPRIAQEAGLKALVGAWLGSSFTGYTKGICRCLLRIYKTAEDNRSMRCNTCQLLPLLGRCLQPVQL